jgi:hypothetical protein
MGATLYALLLESQGFAHVHGAEAVVAQRKGVNTNHNDDDRATANN